MQKGKNIFPHQGKKGVGDGPGDVDQKKFDGTGFDSDLVDSLERDIVSRNPNIHWYGTVHPDTSLATVCVLFTFFNLTCVGHLQG